MPYTTNYTEFRELCRERAFLNGSQVYSESSLRTATGTRTGERVDNWKEKVRAGQNAGSPYSLDRSRLVRWDEGDVVYTSRYRFFPFTQSTVAYQGSTLTMRPLRPNHLTIAESGVNAAALAKVYKKIREEQQHLNSPAIIAEFLDVVRQFGAPFEALVDLTNRRLNRLELERRGLKGTVSFKKIKWAQIVASTYLEWSFGLAPLIDDTAKAAEALARWQTEAAGLTRPRAKVQSRAKQEAVTATSEFVTGSGTLIPFLTSVKTKTECRVQYTVGLEATPLADFGSNDRLIQLLGFDHRNWIPAVWEAVPWSWLIDYFTNVQQILEAGATVTSGVKWIVKTVTYVTTRETYSRLDYGVLPKNVLSGGDNLMSVKSPSGKDHCGRSTVVRTTLTRTLPSSLGVPPLTLEYPGQVKQLANMAAVLVSRRPSSSALWLI